MIREVQTQARGAAGNGGERMHTFTEREYAASVFAIISNSIGCFVPGGPSEDKDGCIGK